MTNFDTQGTACLLYLVPQVDDVTYQLQNNRIRCTSMHGGGLSSVTGTDKTDPENGRIAIRHHLVHGCGEIEEAYCVTADCVEIFLDFRGFVLRSRTMPLCVQLPLRGVSQSQRDRALRDLKSGRAHVLTPSPAQPHRASKASN